jgi:hypothetical protein
MLASPEGRGTGLAVRGATSDTAKLFDNVYHCGTLILR